MPANVTMSTSKFQADLDSVVRHVDSYTQPTALKSLQSTPCTKQNVCKEKMINDLDLMAQTASAMKTKESSKSSGAVIVCSEKNINEANSFVQSLNWKEEFSVLQCKEPDNLSANIALPSLKHLVLLVDSELCDVLVSRRRLCDAVYDFMEALEKCGKWVYLVNKMKSDNHRFKNLFYQLPPTCARMFEDLTIGTRELKHFQDLGLEGEISTTEAIGASDQDNNVPNEGESVNSDFNRRADDILPELTEKMKKETIAEEMVKKSFTPKDRSEQLCKKTDGSSVTDTPPAVVVTRQMCDASNSSSVGDLVQQTSVKTLASSSSREPGERVGDRGDGLVEEESMSEEEEATFAQIGFHNTMNIHWSDGQPVIARQEGSDNIINVNIVPSNTKSKSIIIITTSPSDPTLEQLLVKEIDDQCDVINISLQALDASLVRVSSGSIVLEIQVKPGHKIDDAFVQGILKTVFNDKVAAVVPEGKTFKVQVQTNMVLPLDQLGQYVYLNKEDLHRNCVSKEKYNEKVKEVQQLEKKLISGILEDPKQDLVLRKALHNFVSSIVSEFAFAVAPEKHQESAELFKYRDTRVHHVYSSMKPQMGKTVPTIDDFEIESQIGDVEASGLTKDDRAATTSSEKLDAAERVARELMRIGDEVGQRFEEKTPIVERVLKRKHIIDGQEVDVSRYIPEKPKPVREEKPRHPNTIVVEGVGTIPDETLAMYFENTRRSGGGGVTHCRRESNSQVVYITFENPEVVDQIIARSPHVVHGKELAVAVCTPVMVMPKSVPTDRIVVRGVQDISDDILYLYFENRRRSGGDEVKELCRDSDSDVAYITFHHTEVAEQVVARAPHVIQRKEVTVEAFIPEISTTGSPDTVAVGGVRAITDDTLKLYFENRMKSGGASVKEVWRDAGGDVAYITFIDSEDEMTLTELEKNIMSSLVSIGDRKGLLGDKQEEIYEKFSSAVHQSVGDDTSWKQIALLFGASKKVISIIGAGSSMANFVKDITTRYVVEKFATWIVDQGGWQSMIEEDMDSDVD